LLIALLALAVLSAVDLHRNESEVFGDGLCVDQLCWIVLKLNQLVANSIASNNAIRIGNELDSNSERIRCTELGCCVRILEALDPVMDPSRNQRAGTLNHIGPDCDSQFELDWMIANRHD
jgi:hypothetical protein